MRKPRSFQLGEAGSDHCYHVVSRVAGREVLFGEAEREAMAGILRRQLEFSGLRAVAWCLMGNHFHLLLEVPDKERALAGWGADEYLARLEVFGEEVSTRRRLVEAGLCRERGDREGLERIVAGVRARLYDLSAFMKEFKQRMTGWYNARHGRTGTLWEGVFKSVLVEEGRALEAVSAYIDLNPIRAGLVGDPGDYRWCGYGAAVAGDAASRRGIGRLVVGPDAWGVKEEEECPGWWDEVLACYRLAIFGAGEERNGMRGFGAEEVRRVWESGGRLTLREVLRCRVRYFTDGVVLGTAGFVDRFFEARREFFGKGRVSGARRLRGAEWGGLRTLRDLRVEVIEPPFHGGHPSAIPGTTAGT